MPWEIEVNMDVDKQDVGRVTATWTDPDRPSPDGGATFTHSDRVKATTEGAADFIDDAIAARDEWQAKWDDENGKSGYVLNEINSADPQVT